MVPRKIDFANIINELGAAGVPTRVLADETGPTAASFSAISAGRNKEPAWSIGDYLIRKHAEVFRAQ